MSKKHFVDCLASIQFHDKTEVPIYVEQYAAGDEMENFAEAAKRASVAKLHMHCWFRSLMGMRIAYPNYSFFDASDLAVFDLKASVSIIHVGKERTHLRPLWEAIKNGGVLSLGDGRHFDGKRDLMEFILSNNISLVPKSAENGYHYLVKKGK